MKVYIVERGCYSDRYVAAVYSSRELAEADVFQHTDGKRDEWNSSGSIDEYEVDECAGHVRRPLFSVKINLESGNIQRVDHYMTVADPHERSRVSEIKDFRRYAWSDSGLHQEVISYESFEHAEKVASEARQAWLRAKQTSETDTPK